MYWKSRILILARKKTKQPPCEALAYLLCTQTDIRKQWAHVSSRRNYQNEKPALFRKFCHVVTAGTMKSCLYAWSCLFSSETFCLRSTAFLTCPLVSWTRSRCDPDEKYMSNVLRLCDEDLSLNLELPTHFDDEINACNWGPEGCLRKRRLAYVLASHFFSKQSRWSCGSHSIATASDARLDAYCLPLGFRWGGKANKLVKKGTRRKFMPWRSVK